MNGFGDKNGWASRYRCLLKGRCVSLNSVHCADLNANEETSFLPREMIHPCFNCSAHKVGIRRTSHQYAFRHKRTGNKTLAKNDNNKNKTKSINQVKQTAK